MITSDDVTEMRELLERAADLIQWFYDEMGTHDAHIWLKDFEELRKGYEE